MTASIRQIVLKLAALCNLNCTYCYIYNHEDQSYRTRPTLISDDVFNGVLAAMKKYCEDYAPHKMLISFHGGEPTLIGPERFETLVIRAKQFLGDHLEGLGLQTNATLLNDRWAEIFSEHEVDVGISLDGMQRVHDAARVDHSGRGSYARVINGVRLLQSAGVEPMILCVISPGQNGLEVYRSFRSLGIQRMDFLFPDVSHDNKKFFYGLTGNTPVADYLIPIFDAWMAEDNPEIEIRVFWDLITELMGGKSTIEFFGNRPMSYLVVETDGSIEVLDALRVCSEGLGQTGLNIMTNGFDELARGSPFVSEIMEKGFPLPQACRACHEREVCGGGYPPQRYSRERGFDNASVWCADILKLLAHIRTTIGDELYDHESLPVATSVDPSRLSYVT